MKKILYVVHRYAPFPGGSENHIRILAEETNRRGHHACVLAGEHCGDWNGVRVTSDLNILNEPWDLVVVHGGDVHVQNILLTNIKNIPWPVMYLIIKPSESPVCLQGLRDAKYIGCGTPADWAHVQKHGATDRSFDFTLSINEMESKGLLGFKEKYGIKTSKMFLSCGGFWPHKAMKELVVLFNELNLPDTTLVLTGYDNRSNCMPEESEFVKPLMVNEKIEVMSAMREADLYIMHSFEEGFGLVLLESMINKTPWVARNIAAATLLNEYGMTYETDEELKTILKSYTTKEAYKKQDAYEFVMNHHLSKHALDDILGVIQNN